MKSDQLDLDNPIFAVYLNIDGLTGEKAEYLVERYKKFFRYDNCTFWIIAVRDQKTNIGLIWKGQKYDTDSKSIKNIYKRMSNLTEILSEGTTDDVLKQKLRDFTLNEILDDE